MGNRNKINVTLDTKGILVYAIPKMAKTTSIGEWILLIGHVENTFGIFGNEYEMIYVHASICVKGSHLIYPGCTKDSFPFGVTRSYDFYEVTEEERKHMQDLIKRNGLKYVKALNKMIDR
jgi:hypothetical protein